MVATATAKSGHFSPDDYVITCVRRAIHNKQDVLVTLDGRGELIVRGGHGEYLAGSNIDPPAFFTCGAEQFGVSVLGPDDVERRVGAQVGRNIDELMWVAGFYASGGRLMEGCNTYDVVQLRHWPNLSRLPHTPNTMRIIAMLTRHPTSVSLAHRLLKIDPAELYQIYSAARCAGLVRVVNGTAHEPVLKPHRNQTLLSSLMAKIVGM